ncbi:MAG: endonuclease NucS [archaeon YNP-LCB-024-027]|nr:endonuclease NucS [Candidatus Culexarchaeum yellowstonense]
MTDYFLISVSSRQNLDLCMRYALAGFTNSINGLWTFLDVEEGDYVSFLYGARVYNLYKVVKKEAYEDADRLPPWPPITFKVSRRTYYFPFRLHLRQERELCEPMVRPEFSYVAENLLLRGDYRKTHFQADAVTFYNVSNMGSICDKSGEKLELGGKTFVPKIVFDRGRQKDPWKFYFQELILQSLVRKKMRNVLGEILSNFNISLPESEFEILGEKALPEGFVDVFIKLKHPQGSNIYLLVEVKTGRAGRNELEQLKSYVREFGNECRGGILIAKEFSKKNIKTNRNILLIKYEFEQISKDEEYSYDQLMQKLNFEIVQ